MLSANTTILSMSLMLTNAARGLSFGHTLAIIFLRLTPLQLRAPKSTRPITCRAFFAQPTTPKVATSAQRTYMPVFRLSPCRVKASTIPKTTQQHPETQYVWHRGVIWTRARISAVAVPTDSTSTHRPSSFPRAALAPLSPPSSTVDALPRSGGMSQVDLTSKPDKGSDASSSVEDRVQNPEHEVVSPRQHRKAQKPGGKGQKDGGSGH
jgi:hypothetical protein